MEQLAGRVAVVTGAGSGMGRAFALALAGAGMKIVAADIQDDALDAIVADLSAAGHEVAGVQTDVSDPAAVRALADTAFSRFGAVHVLCNNAGVEGYLDGPIWAATPRDWRWTVGVNFWSVVHGITEFVPRMIEAGEPGHVVNTCSMTSVIAAGNMYGVTKHAVLALTEVLASDLEKSGAAIGATALCPGTIATNLFRGSRNRPAALAEDDPGGAAARAGRDPVAGGELRDRMHATLAAGMPPAEVAALVVKAIRAGTRYLLTDHEWDERIIARHEAILAGAVGPAAEAGVTASGNGSGAAQAAALAAVSENGAADG